MRTQVKDLRQSGSWAPERRSDPGDLMRYQAEFPACPQAEERTRMGDRSGMDNWVLRGEESMSRETIDGSAIGIDQRSGPGGSSSLVPPGCWESWRWSLRRESLRPRPRRGGPSSP